MRPPETPNRAATDEGGRPSVWRRREVLPVLLLTLGGVRTAFGQRRAGEEFQARAEVVRIGVSVTDRGRQVADLDAADFEVFEDGRRQELSFFDDGELPIALTLMVDASASMHHELERARIAALRMIAALRPDDVTQVLEFDERVRVVQEFTSERQRLQAALESVRTSGQTALRNAIYVTLSDLRRRMRRGTLRRHALVILSDGIDTGSIVTEDDVLAQSRRAPVVVHAIGLLPESIPKRDRQLWGRSAHLLVSLSRETGGEARFPRSLSELEPVYDAIGAELRAQYSLGYVPSKRASRKDWRRITVRVPRRRELAVRYRRGYDPTSP